MAGVAGPMLHSHLRAGIRFVAGLISGGAAAGVLLAVPTFLLATVADVAIPSQVRPWVLALTCGLFAVADLANRTPQLRRQVPQELVRRLPAGRLGVAWGFDLGLLFTTRKVTSLIWLGLAAAVLGDPAEAAALTVGVATVYVTAIGVASAARPVGMGTWLVPVWRWVRVASGTTMSVLFVLTVVQAWRT